MAVTGEEIIALYHHEMAKRSMWDNLWQEIGDYLLPRRSNVTKKVSPGAKTTTYIKSSTPIKCLDRLSSVLYSMLTNAETQWFQLLIQHPYFNNISEVKLWLDEVTEIMRQTFYHSNFSMEAKEYFTDLGGLGTAVMYFQEDASEIFHFKTVPIYTCVIMENAYGRVDTIMRQFTATARQAIEQWGEDNVPDKIKNAAVNIKPYEEFDFLHVVRPRTERDAESPFSKDMPYASYYVECGSRKIVSVGGYMEFPYAVSRWSKMSGEIYGRGPGEEALPDIKSLYAVRETTLKAGKKAVDPPLDVPVNAYDHAIRTGSGQINWRNANFDPIRPLNLIGQLPWGKEEEESLKDDIRDTFYITQLQLIDRKQMTLGEVEQRTIENMRILGPTFGRLVYEMLNPIIKRAYGILERARLIPRPPDVLLGQKIAVEYQSPLAMAQLDIDIQSIVGAINLIMPMAQAYPEILDHIDYDKVAQLIMKKKGAPQAMIRDSKSIQQIRQARAQQLAEEAQIHSIERGATVRKNLQGSGMENG